MPSIAPDNWVLPDYSDCLHVAVAVIENENKEILIAHRHEHLHQGGLWEFPGGKVEDGETVSAALERELTEELGIKVRASHPLIRIPYSYPDRKVLLDVWAVTSITGEPHGVEGQDIRWVSRSELDHYEFPAANFPIIKATQLPSKYMVTPDPGAGHEWDDFLQGLQQALEKGVKLVQFRAPTLNANDFLELANKVVACCHQYGTKVLLNAEPDLFELTDADGLHLNSKRLFRQTTRPILKDKLLAASCHTIDEINHAEKIDVDFVVLSPVLATASHPGVEALGWNRFQYFTEQCKVPVYALGGMKKEHLNEAWRHGAQGIAAIRSLWSDEK